MNARSSAPSNAQSMLGANHATNATDVRNVRHQDQGENPSVPDPRNPVDNGVPRMHEVRGHLVFGVPAAVTWWHGGRFPSGGVLTPQPVMRSGRDGDGFVYITTDRDLAATYAATLTGSWLMQVQPVGDVEPDPESILGGVSFRCREAVVLRRYELSRAEREARAAVMHRLWVS